MEIIDVPIQAIHPARYNANTMDAAMTARLTRSIQRFGVVTPLVARCTGPDAFEAIGGNQRLTVLRGLGFTTVPCVIVAADDLQARLLSEVLNRIHGEDDLGLRAELLREVLAALPQEEVLALLPETQASLTALASLGKDTIADQLRAFTAAQQARLRHLQFQLTSPQLAVVQQALARVLSDAGEQRRDSPNGLCPLIALSILSCEKWGKRFSHRVHRERPI